MAAAGIRWFVAGVSGVDPHVMSAHWWAITAWLSRDVGSVADVPVGGRERMALAEKAVISGMVPSRARGFTRETGANLFATRLLRAVGERSPMPPEVHAAGCTCARCASGDSSVLSVRPPRGSGVERGLPDVMVRLGAGDPRLARWLGGDAADDLPSVSGMSGVGAGAGAPWSAGVALAGLPTVLLGFCGDPVASRRGAGVVLPRWGSRARFADAGWPLWDPGAPGVRAGLAGLREPSEGPSGGWAAPLLVVTEALGAHVRLRADADQVADSPPVLGQPVWFAPDLGAGSARLAPDAIGVSRAVPVVWRDWFVLWPVRVR